MNIRIPVIVAIVATAAGCAVFRAAHPVAPGAAVTVDASPGVSALRASRRAKLDDRNSLVVVYVAGAVRHRGIYRLPASARAYDAVDAAGGAMPDADLVAVNLAEPLADGDEVAVPALGREVAPARARSHRLGSHDRAHHKKKRHRKRTKVPREEADASGGRSSVVELNSADESELETLPGIGPALAQRIVAFREQTGPYASPDDLLDVAGMTPAKLDAIEPYVSAGS
jgi:competence protein ComEA